LVPPRTLTGPVYPAPKRTSLCSRTTSIGKTSLYALIAEGRLEIRKIGKRTLIPAASLRRLIDGEA